MIGDISGVTVPAWLIEDEVSSGTEDGIEVWLSGWGG